MSLQKLSSVTEQIMGHNDIHCGTLWYSVKYSFPACVTDAAAGYLRYGKSNREWGIDEFAAKVTQCICAHYIFRANEGKVSQENF